MKKNIILLTIMVAFLLTGCNDGQEIDERNFVLSVGIDKGMDEVFEVSMGIANPATGVEDNVEEEMKTGEGSTLVKAMKENESNYSRNMYYGHTKTVIISDELLRDKDLTAEIVDTIMRNNEFSLKTLVLCSEGSAIKCIEAVQTEDRGDGLYIWDYYKNNAANVENTIRLTLKDLEVAVKTKDTLVIPMIKVEEDKPVIGGGSVFDGEKMIGTLSSEEMMYYALTNENCEGYLLQTEVYGEDIPIFLKKSSCDKKTSDGEIKYKVKVKGNIEGQGNIDLDNNEEIVKVEEALKAELEEKIKETMTTIANMELEEFTDKEIFVEVEAKIYGTGVIR